MKIMTYNILNGGIDDKGSRIEYIINVINKEKPDFLAIQEANNFDKNNNELLKRISDETNLPYYILSPGALCDNKKRYHVVSLSRHPVREEHMFFSDAAVQSAALSVVIDSPLGELSICNVHLNARSENERLKEIKSILKFQSKYKNHIILGDFNAIFRTNKYSDLTAREFTYYDLTHFYVTDLLKKSYVDTLTNLNIKDRSTHPTSGVGHPISKSPIRIDHVFITSLLSSHIKSGSVIKTEISEIASDHYPVVVTLD